MHLFVFGAIGAIRVITALGANSRILGAARARAPPRAMRRAKLEGALPRVGGRRAAPAVKRARVVARQQHGRGPPHRQRCPPPRPARHAPPRPAPPPALGRARAAPRGQVRGTQRQASGGAPSRQQSVRALSKA